MNYDISNAVTLLAIDCRNYQTLSIQCRPALGEPTTAVVEAKRAWGPSPTDPAVSFATAATLTLDGSAITEIDTTNTAWVHIVVTTAQAGVSFDMDFTTTGDMRGDVVEQRIDLTAAGSRSFIAAGRAASMIVVPEGAVSTGALEIKQAVASTYPTVAFATAATLTLDGATVREIDTPSAGALIVDCTTAQAGLYAQLYAYIREEADSDSDRQGFADYNDAATSTTPIALTADTWTVVTNDTLGAFTNTTYLPLGVSSLFSSNEIDVSELDLGDAILIRYDFTLTPSINGAFAELRLSLGAGGSAYTLPRPVGTLSNGSGYDYQITGEFYVYMGDTNTRDNPIGIEVKCSEDAELVNAGLVVQVIRK